MIRLPINDEVIGQTAFEEIGPAAGAPSLGVSLIATYESAAILK